MNVTPRLLSEVVQTPVTPVSVETLAPLLTLIKQEPHDEMSKQCQQRLVQKITKEAQISYVKNVLQRDHIQFLVKMNNESKPH